MGEETRLALTGIVLAGGKSRRFGSDKAVASLHGRTLLEHVVTVMETEVAYIVVVGRTQAPESRVPLTCVADVYPGCGGLGGLYSGLMAAPTAWCLALGCDMPLVRSELIERMVREVRDDLDVVIPRLDEPEPLHALYHRRCADPIRRRLNDGALKMTGFLDDVRVRWMTAAEVAAVDPEFRSFLNVNTQDDFARASELLDRGHDGLLPRRSPPT